MLEENRLNFRLLVAVDDQNAIGYQGHLPFSLRKDIRYFRECIEDSIAIGTRKTVNQMGKPPRGTRVWGITRTGEIQGKHWEKSFFNWREAVLEANKMRQIPWIVGGEWLFKESLQEATELYITRVQGVFPADTYFPSAWEEWFPLTVSQIHEEESGISFSWEIRRR